MFRPTKHLAGGYLDAVDNANIKKLWTRTREYVKKHGGQTTAGPSTLKRKYRTVLVQDIPEFLHDPKPCKTDKDHRAYEKLKVRVRMSPLSTTVSKRTSQRASLEPEVAVRTERIRTSPSATIRSTRSTTSKVDRRILRICRPQSPAAPFRRRTPEVASSQRSEMPSSFPVPDSSQAVRLRPTAHLPA